MKKIFWLLPVALLLMIQLIPINTGNPSIVSAADVQQAAKPPAEVMQILKEACYDCHSNETQYPWYANVAPVSWWIVNHVEEGRSKLNFSEFGNMTPADRSEALDDAAEAVQEGEMPLTSYTWMHPKAKLTAAQRGILVQWFNAYGEGGNEAGNEPAARSIGEKAEQEEDD